MILPFKGLFYNQDEIDSLGDVVTPPYDVISDELQKVLLDKNPYNFCHVDLPQETGDLRYQNARQIFTEWKDSGVILQDKTPAIYLHRHTFFLPSGKKISRVGFFAACQIEDFSSGKILPHEKTLDAPKEDRFRLMQATESNLSAVFSLYEDPQNNVVSLCKNTLLTTPFFDFITNEGERHEMWKILDRKVIDPLCALMSEKSFFIADGHHRYETALRYRDDLLKQNPELPFNAASRFVLMYFVNLCDDGLVILPIHRCLHNLDGFSETNFLEKIKPFFEVKTFSQDDLSLAQKAQGDLLASHHAFLMLCVDANTVHLLSVSHTEWQKMAKTRDLNSSLAELDVTVLHNEILQNQLGIREEDLAKQTHLIYEKSTDAALAQLKNKNCELVFLLNPTKIEHMQNVAKAHLKMPQKSTFFYPKVVSGLVMHSVNTNAIDG